MLLIAVVCGLRIGEVTVLKVSSLDFKRKLIQITGALDYATRKEGTPRSDNSAADRAEHHSIGVSLRNGLTDMQRLFLFGKLSGLNDKDAAITAGYSLSAAENTGQRIWKPPLRAKFERLQRGLQNREPLF